MDRLEVLCGDALVELRKLPAESVQCCVTSPPYWGLRDYGISDQLGLEKTPEEYVAKMVEVFREVRRVLRKDGTLWLNLGDSYAGGTQTGRNDNGRPEKGRGWAEYDIPRTKIERNDGLKPKDLCGIPWRVAFALQADGWWLRSDIIWAKPNPMPESVTDRPTKSHEYLFLLTKSANYFYDAEAIKERASTVEERPFGIIRDREWGYDGKEAELRGRKPHPKYSGSAGTSWNGHSGNLKSDGTPICDGNRNKRSVWTIEDHEALAQWLAENEPDLWQRFRLESRNKKDVWPVATAPYPEAHFATYPPDLIKPCILAGTSAKGCCAKCGSPWERMVDVSYSNWADGNNNGRRKGEIPKERMTFASGKRCEKESKTIGWQPTCKCSSTDLLGNKFCKPIKPCTVLDPFAGSGTTGQVALELGRRAILIELNPKYVELIKKRCNITPGLALA